MSDEEKKGKVCEMSAPEPVDTTAGLPELSRAEILAADDLELIPMAVPEWKGKIYLRVMTGSERGGFEASVRAGKGGKKNLVDFRERFARLVICDSKGQLLFSKADILALREKSGAVLDRVLEKGFELNHIGEQDVKDLVKNSESDRSDDSG